MIERGMIERAQPHLGTLVQIGVALDDDAAAYAAIDAGFAAIASIHRLMSFHDTASDVSRLNRDASRTTVAVAPHTFAVIAKALEISAASGGAFDITVAPKLVEWGVLPSPGATPDATATWRDIELCAPDRVHFHKPLWIDLGGIAKGYAVDHAFRDMNLAPGTRAKVNAGGDVRILGAERVLLRVEGHETGHMPVVDLENAALASSSGAGAVREAGLTAGQGCHIDGVSRMAIGVNNFVSVVAEECMIADALTKVVLAQGLQAHDVLMAFRATAYLHDAKRGWQILGVQ
jgi:thiamine biosynthesis lipoprotein